jgi:hypothetical protein
LADEIVKMYGHMEEWGKRRDIAPNPEPVGFGVPLHDPGLSHNMGTVIFKKKGYADLLLEGLLQGETYLVSGEIHYTGEGPMLAGITFVPQPVPADKPSQNDYILKYGDRVELLSNGAQGVCMVIQDDGRVLVEFERGPYPSGWFDLNELKKVATPSKDDTQININPERIEGLFQEAVKSFEKYIISGDEARKFLFPENGIWVVIAPSNYPIVAFDTKKKADTYAETEMADVYVKFWPSGKTWVDVVSED